MTTSPSRDEAIRVLLALTFERQRRLEQLIQKHVRRRCRTEELLQDVRVSILEVPVEFPMPANPWYWLLDVTLHKALDEGRRISANPDLTLVHASAVDPDSIDERTPERALSLEQELTWALSLLERVPPRRRQALIYRRIDGLTQLEIAHRMHISVNTVEQTLRQAAHHITYMRSHSPLERYRAEMKHHAL